MGYKLFYASLPLGNDVKENRFNTWSELVTYLKNEMDKKKDDRVYLYSYGGLENPIIVSCNPFHILRHFMTIDTPFSAIGFNEHHIHEYQSYEDAYKVAKDMMEAHPLCYNK